MQPAGHPLARVALVGISGYGRLLLEQLFVLQSAGRLCLVAVVVINPTEEEETCQRLRSKGCRLYPNLTAMLAAESRTLTLCLLPTPIHLHRSMAEQVLSAGVNVLLEKPVAATIDEVDSIISSARRHQRVVAIGFQNLYASEVHQLKRFIVNGDLGRLSAIDVLVLWPRPVAYYTRNQWAGRLRIGDDWVLDSPLNNAAAHFMMMALFLAGPSFMESAKAIALEGGLWRAQRIESFDTAAVSFLTAENCRLNILVTHSCRTTDSPVLRVQGDRGTAEWRLEKGVHIKLVGGPETFLQGSDLKSDRATMITEVLDHIAGGNTFICTPELAREHTRCIAAIHDYLPILDFPPAIVRSLKSVADRQDYVEGIEAVLRRCWEASALPSEVSVIWVRNPQSFDLRSYRNLS